MSNHGIIAIDGPAGSGKSTIGKLLAEYLGYLYFDTGILYRAVTFLALRRGVQVDEKEKVVEIAQSIKIDIRQSNSKNGGNIELFVDGEDVTSSLHTPEVDENVSVVAAHPGVRSALKEQQRRIGLQGNIVMVGRDIGSVILPEADLKIYLDASTEERALRRYRERIDRGEMVDYDSILATLQDRDRIDSTREVAPLKLASGAVVIDTDGLNIREVMDKLKEVIEDQAIRKRL